MAKQCVSFSESRSEELITEADSEVFKMLSVPYPIRGSGTSKLSPISEAKTFIISVGTQERLNAEIANNEAIIAYLCAERKNLFGIEADAKKRIGEMIQDLENRQKLLAKAAKHLDILAKYPLFDLTALSLRDESDNPSLSVHSLNEPETKLVAERREIRFWDVNKEAGWKVEYHTDRGSRMCNRVQILPKGVGLNFASMFTDVLDRLLATIGYDTGIVELSSTFSGLIPSSVRQKIKAARQDFGEEIFLVLEANWQEKAKIDSNENYDPLVIGFKHGLAWLVDAFDLSSIEQEVLRKFVLVKKG